MKELKKVYPVVNWGTFAPLFLLMFLLGPPAVLHFADPTPEPAAVLVLWITAIGFASVGFLAFVFTVSVRLQRHRSCVGVHGKIAWLDDVGADGVDGFVECQWDLLQTVNNRISNVGKYSVWTFGGVVFIQICSPRGVSWRGRLARGLASGRKAWIEWVYEYAKLRSLAQHELAHIVLDEKKVKASKHHPLIERAGIDKYIEDRFSTR